MESKEVKEYREKIKELKSIEPPRCCQTCESFDPNASYCYHYKNQVPSDFAGQPDQCGEWIVEIPF